MGFITGNDSEKATVQPGWDGLSRLNPLQHLHHELTNDSAVQSTASPDEDYRALLARATNDAVRDLDLGTSQLQWREGLRELLGYDLSPTVTDLKFWEEHLHPDDRTGILTSIREAIVRKAESWTGEYRFRHANGTYLLLLERAVILRDGSGQARRFVGSLMDITARKQLQDQLCRSQRMEAFGQLAAGAAHDFNNFLTTILGYSDLVISVIGAKGEVANHVSEIRKAAGRASNLTSQLLAFSRKQALEPHIIEVNAVIQKLERTLLRLLGENIRVSCRLHPAGEDGHIKVDANQLEQILLNLAVNARDAMPRGGDLTLETRTLSLTRDRPFGDRQLLANRQPLAAGDYVVISVIDNGAGMDDHVKAHIFEPFFTTKGEGAGTGLGLATSYGIVRQSGGRIAVESEPGVGTKVEIFLPRVAPPSYRRAQSKKLPTGTESILVLEDDVSVRHFAVRALRNLGYKVTEAADGDDAQRLVTGPGQQHVDLLLTDVVMPRMSGRYFADWLQEMRPSTKVIFISGYLDESLPHGNVGKGGFFLPKPFDQEQLAQTVRQALDS